MARKDVSALTAHLGYWMRQVSNHVSHAFARKLEGEGVTVAEWVVLRELYDVPLLAPSSLAERIGVTRGAITKLADRLIAKALITRAADGADGRAQRLALTPLGRKLVPKLAGLADLNEAELFGHLAPRDREQLARVLREFVAHHQLETAPIS
ncbi:MAG: MarR family transcriptional regulator [Polyangiales bacterium]